MSAAADCCSSMVTRSLELSDSWPPSALRSEVPAIAGTTRALDLALRCLRGLEPTDEVRDLTEQAEGLRTELARWATRPRSPQTRDAIARVSQSIQVSALALLNQVRRISLAPKR
jgi:hypothetical protein